MPADVPAPQRTIALDGNMRYINIHQGDVVRLTDGGQSVTWQFSGVQTVIPLSAVFPSAPDAGSRKVYVHIDPVG